MTRVGLVAVIASSLVLAACGSGSHRASSTSTGTTGSTTTSAQPDAFALKRAVRAALNANHKLSVFVLWHNHIPVWATGSTRGPALASLSSAAAARASRGIRVRLIADRFRVVSVRLDPSFTLATAVALGIQRVRPYGRNGRPLGHSVSLRERARLELRRLGSSERFVVWKVMLLR
jgi:hypothetical protein